MYEKKTILLKEVNKRFAVAGKQISGVVKILCTGKTNACTLTINNADVHSFGIWLIVAGLGDRYSVYEIDNLARFGFELPFCANDFLLVKKEEQNYAVAGGTTNGGNCLRLLQYLNDREKTQERKQEQAQEPESGNTLYEDFLQKTDNYYSTALDEYSFALDNFYINKRSGYFDTVQEQLQKLFELYPPYHLLSTLLPDTYWVKIQRDERFFVLGIESMSGKPLNICYALPKTVNPTKKEDFHIIKQRATDGSLFD